MTNVPFILGGSSVAMSKRRKLRTIWQPHVKTGLNWPKINELLSSFLSDEDYRIVRLVCKSNLTSFFLIKCCIFSIIWTRSG
jgi:hypothetical protein